MPHTSIVNVQFRPSLVLISADGAGMTRRSGSAPRRPFERIIPSHRVESLDGKEVDSGRTTKAGDGRSADGPMG